MNRVAFKTVGCRLNQAETAMLSARFAAAGYAIVPYGRNCDVAVIHSCTVTAKAERTSLRLARSIKRRHPGTLVALIGCAAEVAGPRIRGSSGADIVVGQACINICIDN